MINNQLLDYIKQQLTLKVSRDTISSNLKGAGWNDTDINEAFSAITPVVSSVVSNPVQPQTQPQAGFLSPSEAIERAQATQAALMAQAVERAARPSHKFRKIFFIFLMVVLLGGIGGGVYAYYTGAFLSLPSLLTQSIDSAKSVKSGTYDVTATIDFSGIQSFVSGLSQLSGGLSSDKAIITTKGSYDFSDANNKKNSAVISLDLGALSIAGETRIINNTFYGILTKAPTIAFFPMMSSIENKWLSMPSPYGDNQSASAPFSSSPLLGSNISDKLTADQIQHIYDMTRSASFIKTVKRFSPETVGGELSYHFSFDLDRDGITAYLQSLKSYINTIGSNDSALSAFDPTSLNKALDQVKNFSGEVWIGRNDKLLHKIMLNFGVQPDATKDEQVQISVVGIFSNWNQPVTIVAPDNSVPFETLMSSLTPPAPTPTPTPVKLPTKTTTKAKIK
jgi:hypothetical protein